MWLSPLLWHFIALRIPLCYPNPFYALILSYSCIPLLSLISSDLPGSMSCCVSITHRLCQVGSSPMRGWQCLCDISKAMQGQSLYCLLFTSGPATPNFGSRLTRDRWFFSPDTTAESWAKPLPLEGDDVDRVPARLRAPEQAARVLWDGTAGNGLTSGEEKVFLSSSHFTVYSSWATYSLPTLHVFDLRLARGDSSEALLWRTKSQASGETCCCQLLLQKGQWPEVPLCLMFAKKNKWYKEQTCFLRKSALEVPWTCVIFLLPECD